MGQPGLKEDGTLGHPGGRDSDGHHVCGKYSSHYDDDGHVVNLNKTSAAALAKTPSIKRTRKGKVGTKVEGDHHIENNHHIEKR